MAVSEEAESIRGDLREWLSEYGRRVTLRRMGETVYDPSTGRLDTPIGGVAYTDYGGWGRVGTYRDVVADGTIIQQLDRRVTFVPDDRDLIPKTEDRVLVGSDVYMVVGVQERELSGDFFEFTLRIRR